MKIDEKLVGEMLEVLDELKEELFKEKKEYPFTEWERLRGKVSKRIRKLPDLIDEAAGMIRVEPKAGRPHQLELSRRTALFLFTRLLNKSNRDTEYMLLLFKPLFGFELSYKTIERLYSDEQVKLALHNLFVLLLRDEPPSGNLAGDGTGYSLSVSRHYRSNPEKKGKKYRWVFRAVDLDTGMYVAFGYSSRSEMDAFKRAVHMLKKIGLKISSFTLDKYYSSRKVLKLFDEKTSLWVIPKSNLTNFGPEWIRIITRFFKNPVNFLRQYFKRELSESGNSADKRRFGWVLRQKREDRKESALFSIAVLHNIFTIRVPTG
jgi:transposase